MERTQTLPMSTIEVSPDGAMVRYSFFEPDETVLRELIDDLFLNHWSRIVFGPSVEGAIFEIHFEAPPKLSFADGYLTADLGAWHFHLSLGPGKRPASEVLPLKGSVARAAVFERRSEGDHGIRSWGVRLWNGYDQQMITIWLPNACLSDDRKKVLKERDWSKLELYYKLRHQLLGEPIPSDYETAANLPWPESIA